MYRKQKPAVHPGGLLRLWQVRYLQFAPRGLSFFNNEDFPRFPFDSKPAQGESWNNRWGIFVTRATQSGSWTMNTPSRNADSRLLGWIIAVCSVLFVASVLVMSGETTQIASNTTLVTPTER